jgi:hypothetical protein
MLLDNCLEGGRHTCKERVVTSWRYCKGKVDIVRILYPVIRPATLRHTGRCRDGHQPPCLKGPLSCIISFLDSISPWNVLICCWGLLDLDTCLLKKCVTTLYQIKLIPSHCELSVVEAVSMRHLNSIWIWWPASSQLPSNKMTSQVISYNLLHNVH